MRSFLQALDLHSDIQEALGQVVIPQNENDLENELAELLLDDVPSVPPELPSFGRKTEKNNVDLNGIVEYNFRCIFLFAI